MKQCKTCITLGVKCLRYFQIIANIKISFITFLFKITNPPNKIYNSPN